MTRISQMFHFFLVEGQQRLCKLWFIWNILNYQVNICTMNHRFSDILCFIFKSNMKFLFHETLIGKFDIAHEFPNNLFKNYLEQPHECLVVSANIIFLVVFDDFPCRKYTWCAIWITTIITYMYLFLDFMLSK